MSETRPLCFSCGFAEGLHVHEVRDDGEECVAWPDMDDFNAGFAALRSEVAALRDALKTATERLERIDAYAGEQCEASGCRADPCGPVEYHDVEGVPLCAECWQECLDEAADEERPVLTGNGGKP